MPYLNETELVRFRASISGGLVSEEDRSKLNSISGLKSGAVSEIQSGRISVSVPANGYVDTAIAFNPPFSDAPRVLVTLQTRARLSTTKVSGTALSKSSGTIRIISDYASNQTIGVDWVAVL